MAENKRLRDIQELEKKNNIFKNRPPNLWNEPESIEEQHFLRCSADPFVIYKDDRMKELHEFIEVFGVQLRTFNPGNWQNLVNQVIRVFSEMK